MLQGLHFYFADRIGAFIYRDGSHYAQMEKENGQGYQQK